MSKTIGMTSVTMLLVCASCCKLGSSDVKPAAESQPERRRAGHVGDVEGVNMDTDTR